MSRDLWEALSGDLVVGPELTTLLQTHFHGGRMKPGSDTVELTKEQGSGGDVALFLRFKDDTLVDLDAGPSFTEQDLLDVQSLVAEALLEPRAERVARVIVFSQPEMTGWWRYRDRFQVLPAPPEAPRAGFLLAMHPFILEFAYPASTHGLIALVRRRFRTWELGLLLNLFLLAQVSAPGERHPHYWVIDHEDDFKAKYLNEGYLLPNFVVEADGLSSVRDLQSVTVPAMARATGLTRAYCSMIRRGVYVPHPRHWEILRGLTQEP